MQTEIDGIPVEIIKKNIKNLHIYVLSPDGRVKVTAPKKLTDESIRIYVTQKKDWINKKRNRFDNRQILSEHKYKSGEMIPVLGKQYYLEVEYTEKGNSLVLSGDKAVLTVKHESSAEKREAYINEWYRAVLKIEIEKYLPKWERITGLYCENWQIKNMKTRWGTCNTITKKIWLNLQLAKVPVECIEYVILHELAHLKVKNHNKEFKEILNKYMPGWKTIKKQLNEYILF